MLGIAKTLGWNALALRFQEIDQPVRLVSRVVIVAPHLKRE